MSSLTGGKRPTSFPPRPSPVLRAFAKQRGVAVPVAAAEQGGPRRGHDDRNRGQLATAGRLLQHAPQQGAESGARRESEGIRRNHFF